MGFFDLLFGKGGGSNDTGDKDNFQGKKPRGGPLNAFLGAGKYAKTEEEKKEIQEAKKLENRLSEISIKRYNNDREPDYDDNKKRIKVGQGFNLRNLPDLIYDFAQKNKNNFRGDIGGRFDLKDRRELRRIMSKSKRHAVNKMKQRLNRRDEKRCKASLADLF